MNDMSSTIIAKSDQWNAADLIGTNRTITIREVRIKAGDDQPVSVLIEGEQKMFRPCKGVRRLMVRVWGADASKYIGQSMTIFCDPSVTWAGKEEGGIRVSHMSGLDEEIIEYMRTSRAATKPYKILLIRAQQKKSANPDAAQKWVDDHLGFVAGATTLDRLAEVQEIGKKAMAKLAGTDLHAVVTAAYAARLADITADDPFEPEQGRTDEQHGDQFDGGEAVE